MVTNASDRSDGDNYGHKLEGEGKAGEHQRRQTNLPVK